MNPRGVSWSSIADHVAKLAGVSKIVTLLEWVQLLEESGKTRKPTDPTSHPALKLVDFFKTLSKVDKVSGNGKGRYKLDGLVEDSETAAGLQAVTLEWIEIWMRGWN